MSEALWVVCSHFPALSSYRILRHTSAFISPSLFLASDAGSSSPVVYLCLGWLIAGVV